MHTNYEPSGLDNIIVRPVYLRAVNSIVQPEIQVPCSLYFFQKWLPRLGALRWSLVLALRTLCNQRQADGTNRGEISRGELANAVGVHEATISRILNTAPSSIHHGWRVLQPITNDDEETTWLAKFIPRLRYKYERDPVAAVTRRVGYVIDVVMDDPLIPQDEERLAVLIAEQVLQAQAALPTVKTADTLAHVGEAHSTPDGDAHCAASQTKKRGQNSGSRGVKSQNTLSYESVKQQNVTDTSSLQTQYAASQASVNQHKASYHRGSTQNRPTLTLTSNYTYRGITIDLTLTRKREIRAALTPLVDLAAECLNDHHSKGMFFSTLTQLYPDHLDVFITALETAEREGRLSQDINMGAVFVSAIRELAAQAGAEFQLGKPKGSPNRDAGPAERESGVTTNEVSGPLNQTVSIRGAGVSARQLWPSVLQEMKARTTRANFEMWLRNCELLGFDGDIVVVGAPSAFARDWIDERLLSVIQNVLREVMGKEVRVRCDVRQRGGGSSV